MRPASHSEGEKARGLAPTPGQSSRPTSTHTRSGAGRRSLQSACSQSTVSELRKRASETDKEKVHPVQDCSCVAVRPVHCERMNSSDRYAFLKTPVQSYKSFPQDWTPARTITNPDAVRFEALCKERGYKYEVTFNAKTIGFLYYVS